MYVWYIYLHLPYFTIKNQPNVGKYTSPMDGKGMYQHNPQSSAYLMRFDILGKHPVIPPSRGRFLEA